MYKPKSRLIAGKIRRVNQYLWRQLQRQRYPASGCRPAAAAAGRSVSHRQRPQGAASTGLGGICLFTFRVHVKGCLSVTDVEKVRQRW